MNDDKGKETPLTDPMDEYFEKEQQRYLPITGRQMGKATATKAIVDEMVPDLSDFLSTDGNLFGISGKEYEQWKKSGAVVYKDGSESTVDTRCKHEPIDVGFMQTKMVCKKCDKDL